METTSVSLLVIATPLAAVVALAALVLWARDRLVRPGRLTLAEREAAERTRMARLAPPDWDALARARGRPVPPALRALYEDRALVARTSFVVQPPTGDPDDAWYVAEFVPLNLAGDEDPDLEGTGAPRGSIHFADGMADSLYYVAPGALPDGDGPVYLYQLSAVEGDLVAPSLRDFLSWPREP